MTRCTRAVLGLVAGLVLLAGCGTSTPDGVAGTNIKPIAASSLPDTIVGLEVAAEDIKNVVSPADNTYLNAVGLYSMRRGNLVFATLQVSRTTDKFDNKDAKQRSLLADKIGGARSEERRIGSDRVFLTQGTRQRIAVWFKGRDLFILSVRDDFEQPRALLREALEIQL